MRKKIPIMMGKKFIYRLMYPFEKKLGNLYLK